MAILNSKYNSAGSLSSFSLLENEAKDTCHVCLTFESLLHFILAPECFPCPFCISATRKSPTQFSAERFLCVHFWISVARPNMVWLFWLFWLYHMPPALQKIADSLFLTINHLFYFLQLLVCFQHLWEEERYSLLVEYQIIFFKPKRTFLRQLLYKLQYYKHKKALKNRRGLRLI